MCGIAGVLSFGAETTKSTLNSMIQTLNHRGPDNQTVLRKKVGKAHLGLAHARLSILDLSEAGCQPMIYRQFTIIYNGEIYNFKEIKEELSSCGHIFETESDTEIILHAFEEWGKKAIHKFIGMFAFVLLDEKKNRIYLYRDRAGVKPLYYFWDGKTLIFGSELKALKSHPYFNGRIDMQAVGYYFKMGYVPAPHCIFQQTSQLLPGHYLEVDLSSPEIEQKQYWNPEDYFKKPKTKMSYGEAKYELKELLQSAYQYRMVSDVPVGVFLSGGYDSTSVAALLQHNRSEKIKTFTIGFEEGNNEAPYAQATAKYLETEHYEYICTTEEAQNLIPQLPHFYDEPFADSSAIPTMLVSQIAEQEVTVALSADGGDEVFAGYTRYRSYIDNANTLDKLSWIQSPMISDLLTKASSFLQDESFVRKKVSYLSTLLSMPENKRLSSMFEGSQGMSEDIFSKLLNYEVLFPDLLFEYDSRKFSDSISIAQLIDYQNYLPNDILTKVDRATMSVSLEGREPMLDHRLLEFAAQLPGEYKFDGVTTKKILKDIVHEYVPKEMMERPKAGFSLPIGKWLKDDLKFLLEEYLSPQALADSGIFNIKYVQYLLTLFEQGKLHDESIIWRILQFQMWYKKWM